MKWQGIWEALTRGAMLSFSCSKSSVVESKDGVDRRFDPLDAGFEVAVGLERRSVDPVEKPQSLPAVARFGVLWCSELVTSTNAKGALGVTFFGKGSIEDAGNDRIRIHLRIAGRALFGSNVFRPSLDRTEATRDRAGKDVVSGEIEIVVETKVIERIEYGGTERIILNVELKALLVLDGVSLFNTLGFSSRAGQVILFLPPFGEIASVGRMHLRRRVALRAVVHTDANADDLLKRLDDMIVWANCVWKGCGIEIVRMDEIDTIGSRVLEDSHPDVQSILSLVLPVPTNAIPVVVVAGGIGGNGGATSVCGALQTKIAISINASDFVLAHELGHAFGLDHPDEQGEKVCEGCPRATMDSIMRETRGFECHSSSNSKENCWMISHPALRHSWSLVEPSDVRDCVSANCRERMRTDLRFLDRIRRFLFDA